MKKLILISSILLIISSVVLAQTTNQTTTTTTPKIPGTEALKGVYNFLVTANPILLLIFGGVLVIVSKFARWIGIILIIIGLIHLLFLLIG